MSESREKIKADLAEKAFFIAKDYMQYIDNDRMDMVRNFNGALLKAEELGPEHIEMIKECRVALGNIDNSETDLIKLAIKINQKLQKMTFDE
jgi:hypothetical protein